MKQASSILQTDQKNLLAKHVQAQSLFMGGKREQGVKVMEELMGGPNPTEDMYINTIQMYMATGRMDDALALVDNGSKQYVLQADANMGRDLREALASAGERYGGMDFDIFRDHTAVVSDRRRNISFVDRDLDAACVADAGEV